MQPERASDTDDGVMVRPSAGVWDEHGGGAAQDQVRRARALGRRQIKLTILTASDQTSKRRTDPGP